MQRGKDGGSGGQARGIDRAPARGSGHRGDGGLEGSGGSPYRSCRQAAPTNSIVLLSPNKATIKPKLCTNQNCVHESEFAYKIISDKTDTVEGCLLQYVLAY